MRKITFVLFLVIVLFNVFIGGWAVNEILSWFGKDIVFLGDAVIGLFTGEFTVPIAIIGKLLTLLGVF